MALQEIAAYDEEVAALAQGIMQDNPDDTNLEEILDKSSLSRSSDYRTLNRVGTVTGNRYQSDAFMDEDEDDELMDMDGRATISGSARKDKKAQSLLKKALRPVSNAWRGKKEIKKEPGKAKTLPKKISGRNPEGTPFSAGQNYASPRNIGAQTARIPAGTTPAVPATSVAGNSNVSIYTSRPSAQANLSGNPQSSSPLQSSDRIDLYPRKRSRSAPMVPNLPQLRGQQDTN